MYIIGYYLTTLNTYFAIYQSVLKARKKLA